MLFSAVLHAAPLEERFASGLVRSYSAWGGQRSIAKFLDEEFGGYAEDFQWKPVFRFDDKTHQHRQYALFYRGRPVVDRRLKVHYNRRGFVESASSNWRTLYNLSLPDPSRSASIGELLRQQFYVRYGFSPGLLKLVPVVWVNSREDRVVSALEVTLVSNRAGVFRRFYVDETTGEFLAEQNVIRRLDRKIYPVHPDHGALTSETLAGIDNAATSLESDFLHVRRQQLNGSDLEESEVNPQIEFADEAEFSTDPAVYTNQTTTRGHLCEGTSSECANQAFNGINVYYHLESFRLRLDDYFTDLGSSFALPADPLPVLVNTLGLDLDGDGLGTDEANNAAFIRVPCVESEPANDRCLVFWRPALWNTSTCGGVTQFYDVSREALVAVHEYQHYVTDSLTGMVSGTDKYNVGDALHEGYSDYFAVSHVSEQVGSPVTVVGEYAFKNCATLQRDLSVLKVFDPTSDETGPHIYGLSWASGLWALREEYGNEMIDKLALKSLFLMDVEPGFMDAIETLVQADQALYDGAHVARIRALFYDEVKFVGGGALVFRDADRTVLELGLQSCARVSGRRPFSWQIAFGLFLLWAGATLWGGRKARGEMR